MSRYKARVLSELPVGYWRLGETVGAFADSANANLGTAFGGITRGAFGALSGDLDKAVVLNGSSGYISIAAHAVLEVGDVFTIEAWIKKSVNGTSMSIMAKGQTACQLRVASDNTLELLKENVSSVVKSTIPITDTAYHHVVATKSGATVKLYIDGVDVTGAVANATMFNVGLSPHVGRRVFASDEFFNGTVDEVAIYAHALTATEVQAHYSIGTAVALAVATRTGLAAYYRGLHPPYPRLAGPIRLESQQRRYTLSEPATAQITISPEDIRPEWARVGSCWSIESDLYPEVWAGFVDVEEWGFGADSISVPLVSILDGLLNVEGSLRSIHATAGSAIREAVEAAQARRDMGLRLEILDDGDIVELESTGENVGDFIQSVVEAGGLDYRERVYLSHDGTLEFVLVIGDLRKRFFEHTVVHNDIVGGHFRSKRPASSLSMYGPGITFSEREAATSFASQKRLSGQHRAPTQLERPDTEFVLSRDLGPASGRHLNLIEERVRNVRRVADNRLSRNLRNIEEIALSLDMTRLSLEVGELVRLDVNNWATGFDVKTQANVAVAQPNDASGDCAYILQGSK